MFLIYRSSLNPNFCRWNDCQSTEESVFSVPRSEWREGERGERAANGPFPIIIIVVVVVIHPQMYIQGARKSMQILLSNRQAGPGRTVKQKQKEISRNHVQAFSGGPVVQQNSSTAAPLSVRPSLRLSPTPCLLHCVLLLVSRYCSSQVRGNCRSNKSLRQIILISGLSSFFLLLLR